MNVLEKFVRRLHRDERGSISIVTVFSVMLLATVLGMIINIGRQADRKVRMQNSVDDSAYSGGVVLARSMNTLAFTNHLLCDVFAMTAYLREARDRNSETLSGPVLDGWDKIAPVFSNAQYRKFADLSFAIPEKTRLEREMVRAFSEKNAAVSEQALPVMERILSEELIPQFQHTLIENAPRLAQETTNEIARRHAHNSGSANRADDSIIGVLWRTDVSIVGGEYEIDRPTLPVVDPVLDTSSLQPEYQRISTWRRNRYSHMYLRQLNNSALREFDSIAKMSQFSALWRGFTCGYLEQLLNEEYPDRNLPFVLRKDSMEELYPNEYLESQFMFVAVNHWEQPDESMPGLFENPMDTDHATYAQISLFLPKPRLRKTRGAPSEYPWIYREGVPSEWTLMNQNWTVQLVPATSTSVSQILQTPPPGYPVDAQNLGGLSDDEFQLLNTH